MQHADWLLGQYNWPCWEIDQPPIHDFIPGTFWQNRLGIHH